MISDVNVSAGIVHRLFYVFEHIVYNIISTV